ncbi:MAG: hypothetical protein ACR2QK_07205 [Acidimicrobiales bacterium]
MPDGHELLESLLVLLGQQADRIATFVQVGKRSKVVERDITPTSPTCLPSRPPRCRVLMNEIL